MESQEKTNDYLLAQLSKLAEKYTDIKISYDSEDGYFLSRKSNGWLPDSFTIMDKDLYSVRRSLAEAIEAAIEYDVI